MPGATPALARELAAAETDGERQEAQEFVTHYERQIAQLTEQDENGGPTTT